MRVPSLRFDEVHVVLIRLDGPIEGELEVLDETERARASRFAFERDRRRYIAAHGSTRRALGAYLQQSPACLRFTVGEHGKPRLAGASPGVRFNLTHSGDRAMLAVTLDREVGIDLEAHRQVDTIDLAQRFFSPRERDALEALAPADRLEAFFRCWTRKEAFLKALGAGLALPLDDFDVCLPDGRQVQLLDTRPGAPGNGKRWRLLDLRAEPRHAAALAAEAADWRVVYVDLGG